MGEVAPVMLVNVRPPSAETCHCTVPSLAPAVKLAVVPPHDVRFDGFVVIVGALVTISVAAVDVAEPQLLVKTARYCLALSTLEVVKL